VIDKVQFKHCKNKDITTAVKFLSEKLEVELTPVKVTDLDYYLFNDSHVVDKKLW
jgi:hypothetical protein